MTAAVKAHGLIVDPLNSELHGIGSWAQFLAIEFETLLGLWLVSGLKPQLALRFAFGFFVIVTGVAANLVFERQSSCACFGKFNVNPIYTLILDVLLLAVVGALLLAWSRKTDKSQEAHGEFRNIATYIAVFAFLISLPGLLGLVNYQSLVLRLRGDVLEITPRVVDLETLGQDETATRHISITNHGDAAVRIVGGRASCGCIVYESLPVTIGARSSVTIPISVKLNGGAGTVRVRYVLLTNLAKQPTLDGGLTGQIVVRPKDAR